jgi:hypothetical protein
MLWISIGTGCSAVLIGTTDGTIGAHLLTGGVVPTWQETTPQCLLSSTNSTVVAVRSQVSSRSLYLSLQQVLLLDVIQLDCSPSSSSSGGEYSAHHEEEDAIDTTTTSSCLFLRHDLEAEEVAYCIHVTGGVYAISLPWLPVLSNSLSSSSSIVLPPVFPSATVTTLLSSKSVAVNGGIVDGLPVGDALAGSGVLVVFADGRYRCLSRKERGKQQQQQQVRFSDREEIEQDLW